MSELEQLKAENEAYKNDFAELKNILVKTLDALGLLEDGKMVAKEEIMPNLLKSGGQIMSDAALSDMPIMGKAAKQRLENRFGFFKNLDSLIQKHI